MTVFGQGFNAEARGWVFHFDTFPLKTVYVSAFESRRHRYLLGSWIEGVMVVAWRK